MEEEEEKNPVRERKETERVGQIESTSGDDENRKYFDY